MTDATLTPAPYCNFTQAAINLIAGERLRQVREEGWTPEHDDGHTDGELARAACLYAMRAGMSEEDRDLTGMLGVPAFWPWDPSWWKPGADASIASRRRELVKAGALILAELERLQRAEHPGAAAMPPDCA